MSWESVSFIGGLLSVSNGMSPSPPRARVRIHASRETEQQYSVATATLRLPRKSSGKLSNVLAKNYEVLSSDANETALPNVSALLSHRLPKIDPGKPAG